MFKKKEYINVFGKPLETCCNNPKTGFFRNGLCDTCKEDIGVHTVCILATEDFLKFSKSVGNDLSTPQIEFDFPGLKEGDCWCICAETYAQSINAETACKIYLKKTNYKTLKIIPLDQLKKYAIDLS